MKLLLEKAREPIRELLCDELPAFAILSGLNGAGKTQLLLGMRDGEVAVDGISKGKVLYFDKSTFKATDAVMADQDETYADKLWSRLGGEGLATTLERLFRATFPGIKLDASISDLPVEGVKTFFAEIRKAYPDPSSRGGGPSHLQVFGVAESLIEVLQRRKTLGNPFSKGSFLYHQRPIRESVIGPHLKHLCKSYVDRQRSWSVEQFTAHADKAVSYEALQREYVSLFPPPWLRIKQAFDLVRSFSRDPNFFDFDILHPPDVPSLVSSENTGATFAVVHRSTGVPVELGRLSSGEGVIFAIILAAFSWQDGVEFPQLLLLDEVDASLHPRAAGVLISFLQELSAELDLRIILTTHSPTTVAVAPPSSLFQQTRHVHSVTIQKVDRATLLDSLCEGLLTVNTVAAALESLIGDDLVIFTEGKNREHIIKAFSVLGAPHVKVFPHLEARTSGGDLARLFEVFAHVPGHTPVLFVWDCDYAEKLPSPNNKTYAFALPHNSGNVVQRGIENIYPSWVTEKWVRWKNHPSGEREAKIHHKNDVLRFVLAQEDKAVFKGFESLVEYVRSIQN